MEAKRFEFRFSNFPIYLCYQKYTYSANTKSKQQHFFSNIIKLWEEALSAHLIHFGNKILTES